MIELLVKGILVGLVVFIIVPFLIYYYGAILAKAFLNEFMKLIEKFKPNQHGKEKDE